MHRMGLSPAQLRRYHDTITDTHERRITLEVLTLEGRLIRSLDSKLLDGQVTVDVTRTPTRIADIRILDENRSLDFEPDSPAAIPLHRSRMLRIIDSRLVPGIGDWVDCPVITGVIWDFSREGAEVSLVVHGKEEQMMGAQWTPHTFPKKSKKTNAIRQLALGSGERSLSIPDLPVTLPNRMSILRLDPQWPKARRVAASMTRRLFYNGQGKLLLLPYSDQPVYTFDAALLTEVEIGRPTDNIKNVWEVLGGKPKGSKRRVTSGPIMLSPTHPLSAARLGRNGEWLRLVEHVENDHIKTKRETVRQARRLRDDHAKLTSEYRFDSLPIPHLEEWDMVAVRTDEYGRILIRMREWSIPLGPDPQPMPVGSLKNVSSVRHKAG